MASTTKNIAEESTTAAEIAVQCTGAKSCRGDDGTAPAASASSSSRKLCHNGRIELFFKSESELRDRIQFLALPREKQRGDTAEITNRLIGSSSNNISTLALSIVNKDAKDSLLDWRNTIREEIMAIAAVTQDAGKEVTIATVSESSSVLLSSSVLSPGIGGSICIHYSLKYQRVKRGKVDQHFAKLCQFLGMLRELRSKETEGCSNTISSDATFQLHDEILLISGSNPTQGWTTVEALRRLQADKIVMPCSLAVAYNPFFPEEEEQHLENQRLSDKMATGLVDKVYLQFGTDVKRARDAVDSLQKQHPFIAVAASVFLPTKQLLAQQRFRPWKGVFLSPQFLESSESARVIVVELLRIFRDRNVELLVEAPGVRAAKDIDLWKSLLRERDDDLGPAEDGSSHRGDAKAKPQRQNMTSGNPSKKLKVDKNAKKTGGKQERSSLPLPEPTMQPSSFSPKRSPQDLALILFGSHDVRLFDNHAVQRACKPYSMVLPVFIWEQPQSRWGVRGAAEVVLKAALRSLESSWKLHCQGMPLVCIQVDAGHGTIVDQIVSLVQRTGATAVHYNREMTPESRQQECLLRTAMQQRVEHEVLLQASMSSLLYDIDLIDLATGFNGGHWGTLMPFLKGCQKQLEPPSRPIPRDETLALLQKVGPPTEVPEHLSVVQLTMAFMPKQTPWDQPILDRFPMSEEAAHNLLDLFFAKGLPKYEKERSRADLEVATSRLSVHLRMGTLSPHALYWRTKDSVLSYDATKIFARRLIWRDLAYFQLLCFPQMRTKSIRAHYDKIEWVTGEEESRRLRAWKKGCTGYPIVDAGMRELYATGWMTQSVRMVVASFLVEYLRINWVRGAEWFHDTLVDADSAINPMMWQNAGRSGVDQWNFTMSPETASQDGSGSYTAQWVPELSKLPKKSMHRPWQAKEEELRRAGVILGQTYPHRIVENLKTEREQSVKNVLKMRRAHQERNDNRGYDLITLPTGKDTVVFTKKEYRIDRQGNVLPMTFPTSKKPTTRKAKGKAKDPKRPQKRNVQP